MVQLETVPIGDKLCVGISVQLPQTTVLAVVAPHGYIMCGLLAVERLDALHPERKIIAARVTGVRSVAELLTGRLDAVTRAGNAIGIVTGMTGQEALKKMLVLPP